MELAVYYLAFWFTTGWGWDDPAHHFVTPLYHLKGPYESYEKCKQEAPAECFAQASGKLEAQNRNTDTHFRWDDPSQGRP